MYGAIIGDIAGSTYEYDNVTSWDFETFPKGSIYTDDSITTIAVGAAMLRYRREGGDLKKPLIQELRKYCSRYPFPEGGYGIRFSRWLRSKDPQPYHSWGNGSAMRVSPCAILADSLEEALELAKQSAQITHDHPEGIKGAQATAAAIYLAKTGSSMEEIRDYIRAHYYPMDKTLAQLQPESKFDESCQGTVPPAIEAFLESHSFESAIRNAIWVGGDTDTLAAITGSIAWAYYGRNGLQPDMIEMRGYVRLPKDLAEIVLAFDGYLQQK